MSTPNDTKGGDLERVTTVPSSKQTSFGLEDIKQSLTTREGWLGDYNFAFLCLPNIPFLRPKTKTPPPFFGLNTRLPIVLTVVMGLQHALGKDCPSFVSLALNEQFGSLHALLYTHSNVEWDCDTTPHSRRRWRWEPQSYCRLPHLYDQRLFDSMRYWICYTNHSLQTMEYWVLSRHWSNICGRYKFYHYSSGPIGGEKHVQE